jgi:hypothetical protein
MPGIRFSLFISLKDPFTCLVIFFLLFNPEFAVAIYCGLKILAAPLATRFYSSTYPLGICPHHNIAPTARFATVFCASLRYLLQNLGLTVRASSDRCCHENGPRYWMFDIG